MQQPVVSGSVDCRENPHTFAIPPTMLLAGYRVVLYSRGETMSLLGDLWYYPSNKGAHVIHTHSHPYVHGYFIAVYCSVLVDHSWRLFPYLSPVLFLDVCGCVCVCACL
jgi:hypothetical protein